MKITILNGTTENPLLTIGERAGICWGGDIRQREKHQESYRLLLEEGMKKEDSIVLRRNKNV